MTTELDIRILQLDPMRVLVFNGYGDTPEHQAWDKAIAWLKNHDLGLVGRRFFGFNNPEPTPGSPNYGYDVWVTVDEKTVPDGEAGLIEFTGGRYAVTRVGNTEKIFPTWQNFVAWLEASPYRLGQHPYLEEHLDPKEIIDDSNLQLDLYLPIRE